MMDGTPIKQVGIDQFSGFFIVVLELRRGICYNVSMNELPIKLLRNNAKLPARATSGSVGYDIAACVDEAVVIGAGETKLVGSGFAISLCEGYAAFIYARSGLGIKHGIVPANCVGVIDSDYRGEIIVGVKNHSDVPFTINDGDRIAQMVITKCETPIPMSCDALDNTTRGDGGFGSTGKER